MTKCNDLYYVCDLLQPRQQCANAVGPTMCSSEDNGTILLKLLVLKIYFFTHNLVRDNTNYLLDYGRTIEIIVAPTNSLSA